MLYRFGLNHLKLRYKLFTCKLVAIGSLSMTSGNDVIASAKISAATTCVDENVRSNTAIGIGSGSTIIPAIERISSLLKEKKLNDVICIPTSFQSKEALRKNGVPISDLDAYPELDICIDGADEFDRNLSCIKGGGGCLTQEKIVMSCAKKFFVVADFRKNSQKLGEKWEAIPIEVIPSAYTPIMRYVERNEGGQVVLRLAKAKAGPCVTDNGNFILDWMFPKSGDFLASNRQLNELNSRLLAIPGVIETGLFVGNCSKVYIGLANGTVEKMEIQENSTIPK